MSKSYGTEHSFKDVKFWIYQRNDSDTWHCRIKLPLQPPVRRSLRTSNRETAETQAKELILELLFKSSRGEALNPRSFSVIAEDFLKSIERQIERGEFSYDKLDSYRRYVQKFFVPFFKNRRIDQISPHLIAEYREWRLDYYLSASQTVTYSRLGKKVKAKRPASKPPSPNTLKREESALRQIFTFAYERGDLTRDQVPIIKSPKTDKSRRPAFTIEEWKHLVHTARYRANPDRLWENLKPKQLEQGESGINELQLHQRQLLYNYILILGNSGLRTMEAKNLRWRDIETYRSRNGEDYTRLSVKGKGKNRKTIPNPRVRHYLERIKKRQQVFAKKHGFDFQGYNEYVFSDEKGNQIHSFTNSFNSLLKAADLETDYLENKRSPYSLRHTYATFRLIYGGVDVYELAINMGTSVEMIERHYGHVNAEDNAERITRGSFQ
jgi:integrase